MKKKTTAVKTKPASNVKKSGKDSGIIAVSGHCLDCGETWTDGATALNAIRHHENTGHHVRVEQTIFWERFTKAPH